MEDWLSITARVLALMEREEGEDNIWGQMLAGG